MPELSAALALDRDPAVAVAGRVREGSRTIRLAPALRTGSRRHLDVGPDVDLTRPLRIDGGIRKWRRRRLEQRLHIVGRGIRILTQDQRGGTGNHGGRL